MRFGLGHLDLDNLLFGCWWSGGGPFINLLRARGKNVS